MHKALLLAFGSSLLALAGLAQSPEAPADVGDTAAENGSYGGQAGPDMSIEAMSPEDEAVNVGLAGQDPANIARYLLASGAGGAGLSPDGETIAFRWDVTGEAQLWTLPAEGGQPRQLTFGNGITFSAWAPTARHWSTAPTMTAMSRKAITASRQTVHRKRWSCLPSKAASASLVILAVTAKPSPSPRPGAMARISISTLPTSPPERPRAFMKASSASMRTRFRPMAQSSSSVRVWARIPIISTCSTSKAAR